MFRSLLLQIWIVLVSFLVLVLCSLFVLVMRRFEVRLDTVYQSLYWDVAEALARELKDKLTLANSAELQTEFARLERRDPRLRIFLLDEQGVVRTSHPRSPSTPSPEQKVSFDIRPIRSFLAHTGRLAEPFYSQSTDPDLGNRMLSAVPVSSPAFNGYLLVLVRWHPEELLLPARAFVSVTPRYFLLSGFLLLFAGIGWAVAYGITRQIGKMLYALTTFEEGNYQHRIKTRGTSELNRYAMAINSMAEKTESALQSLQTMTRQRTELLAANSHDLKRPITFMLYALEMLGAEDIPLELAKEEELFERFQNRCQEFSHQIETFSELSELDRPQTTFKKERVDLSAEIFAIPTAFEHVSREKDIELSCSGPQTEVWADIDPILFKRALHNLVENALHYTPIGGRVVVSLTEQERIVRVDVKDTGMGIPPDELPLIFTPLMRGSLARVHNKLGTGIGLAIVGQIVNLHGGLVKAASVLGEGSTFSIEFPRV